MLKAFLALIHPDHRDAVPTTIRNALTSGRASSRFNIASCRAKDGPLANGRGQVVRDAAGLPSAIRGVVFESPRASSSSSARRACGGCSRSSRRSTARARAAIRLASSTPRAASPRRRRVPLRVDRSTRLERGVVPLASAGHADGFLQLATVRAIGTQAQEGPTMRAIRERRPVACSDIANDPAYAMWRDIALSRGFRASAAFPFERDGVAIGALNVYADQPGVFEEEEVQLLRASPPNRQRA